MRSWRALWLAVMAIILVMIAPGRAGAHATLTSFVALDIRDDAIDAKLQLPLDQLGMALKIDLANASAVSPVLDDLLRGYILSHVTLRDAEGHPLSSRVDGMAVRDVDGARYIVAHLLSPLPSGAARRWLTLHDDVILNQVVTHHILVSVRRDFEQALLGQDPKVLGVLTYAQKEVIVPREGASAWKGFRAMVSLGLRHIAEGTDHLLFLIVLLLPAPRVAIRGRWCGVRHFKGTLGAILRIVTSFTVGHSVSLVLGTLGWVVVPSRWVEVAIALSILVTAAHALRPLFARREALLALAFGLVHGLAFATVLQDLGLRRSSLALALLGFNLGIEAMQLAVVSLLLPWLVLLGRTQGYGLVRVAGASLAAVASCGWVGERLTGNGNAISRATENVVHHATVFVALIAFASSVAIVASWRKRKTAPTAELTGVSCATRGPLRFDEMRCDKGISRP